MKKFIQAHRTWFSQFSSAFAGTLLGIGITVGITIFQEQAYKKETTRRFVITTVSDIRNTNDTAKEKVERLVHTDSVFMEVLEYYPDELDQMPIKLINEFAQEINSFDYNGSNKFSINLFVNNPEIINIFDDYSAVNTINLLIETSKAIEKILDEATACKTAIYDIYCGQQNYRNRLSGEEFVQLLLSENIVINKMDKLDEYCIILPELTTLVGQLIDSAMESLDITPDDFAELYSKEVADYHYNSQDEEEEEGAEEEGANEDEEEEEEDVEP